MLGVYPAGTNGLRLGYTWMPGEYDLGSLYQDGRREQDDLLFQYGCITGLRKIWLTGSRKRLSAANQGINESANP